LNIFISVYTQRCLLGSFLVAQLPVLILPGHLSDLSSSSSNTSSSIFPCSAASGISGQSHKYSTTAFFRSFCHQ
jgi:hypothetical protein